MPMFYVYKKEWSHYVENRGVIVIAKDWKRAKGIGMAQMYCKPEDRSNIIVEEINPVEEGVLCVTDYIVNSDKYN